MKFSFFLKFLYASLIFSSMGYAYELPENHYDIIDELECLSPEFEKQWSTIEYNPNDPNTLVLCDWWSKNRGKIIGSIIAPGIGTVIGHQIDVADDRAQSNANARKAAEAEAARQAIAAQEAARQRAEAERIHQEQMLALENQRRADQAAFEAEKQKLKSQVQQLLEQVELITNQIPPHIIDSVNHFTIIFKNKIKSARSIDEAYRIFEEYKNIIDNLFNFNNKDLS